MKHCRNVKLLYSAIPKY